MKMLTQEKHKGDRGAAKRARILEVARRRFSHYGYDKTTMAEIAEDAGMAVGTLYLFFKNKQDIVMAFGESCFFGVRTGHGRVRWQRTGRGRQNDRVDQDEINSDEAVF